MSLRDKFDNHAFICISKSQMATYTKYKLQIPIRYCLLELTKTHLKSIPIFYFPLKESTLVKFKSRTCSKWSQQT